METCIEMFVKMSLKYYTCALDIISRYLLNIILKSFVYFFTSVYFLRKYI